jgi:hypothetical protein
MRKKNLFIIFIILFTAAKAQDRANNSYFLGQYLNSIEQKHNIPNGLLSAISKVESGRYHTAHKKLIAWPWAIQAQGESKFFSTKQEAISAVRALKAKGVKNIDVGVMQVNLYHHPNAFSSLEQAFDPKANIEYAARFLTSLKRQHLSWLKAIAYYHSALPLYHTPYRDKVYKMWKQERKYEKLSPSEENEFSSLFEGVEQDSEAQLPKFKIIHVRSPNNFFSSKLMKTQRISKKNLDREKRIRIVSRSSSNKSPPRSLLASGPLSSHFRFIKVRIPSS